MNTFRLRGLFNDVFSSLDFKSHVYYGINWKEIRRESYYPGICLEELWDAKKFGLLGYQFNYLRFEAWVSRIRSITVNHAASEFCVPCGIWYPLRRY